MIKQTPEGISREYLKSKEAIRVWMASLLLFHYKLPKGLDSKIF